MCVQPVNAIKMFISLTCTTRYVTIIPGTIDIIIVRAETPGSKLVRRTGIPAIVFRLCEIQYVERSNSGLRMVVRSLRVPSLTGPSISGSSLSSIIGYACLLITAGRGH